MCCFLHKWRISAALDTGKPLASGTRRHMENCAHCRTFAQFNGVIEKQLNHDGRELLNALSQSGVEHFRNRRIIDALPATNESASPSIPRATFRPRPVFAALFLVAVIAAAVIFSPFSSIDTTEPDKSFFSALGEKLDFPTPPVQQLAAQVESPLNREIDSLKQAAKSTVEFFKSYLNTGI